ncbi:hypothetical protein Kpol_1024p45 [Vanderwaltozyma polyspora DSM 70294]|uniref:Bud emergence protein 1 n=1 Tax=Vanderwaltozyma polyspora (strain ATCC 22028 / DSM 70294 / BCRC 21397 / CBS 2163 / NBRC 10782 / NRRL Y-8283 / UCD 57-17) TaxID=436907 RepID=A7TLK5_VANPO|nr:uncharacterized protein Kpol_1024p45 [Vanderwaltozyma polyspora DSM 70294]EDO16891.1 hypothetical protein Kpol_1024p45 [Vanderwaltozyma polyspora DSM 70294]
MLKSLKLSKRESRGPSKSRITSADISGPRQDPNSSSLKNVNSTKPSRDFSFSSKRLSGRKSHNSNISSPEKVIKAARSYSAKSAEELSFAEGEFFYVESEDKEWYKASNPTSGRKGLVPKSYFETFDRTRPVSTNGSTTSSTRQQSNESSKMGSLYAIVLYDFQAEKSDELTVYVGENLFICAHHNYEWFIAKPIGRLGGPGLVPVDFVSIIDISTGYATGNDVKEDIKSVNLPTVQEWKDNVTKYKNSNITLGTIDYEGLEPIQYVVPAIDSPTFDSEYITKASVTAFALENDKYWFALTCELSTGVTRKLKRYYQDFYDLQVKLLDSFPSESGKLRDSTGQWTRRIIPYIPGPVPYVTDTITKKRKEDLNVYVGDLINLPEYISRSPLVKGLFDIKKNEYDSEYITGSAELQQSQMNGTDANTSFGDSTPTAVADITNNEDNTLTGEDLRLYDKMNNLSLNSKPKTRPPSGQLPQLTKPTKIKFYYNDDIFALMLTNDIGYQGLRDKIGPRVDGENFELQVKTPSGEVEVINSDGQISHIIEQKLKITVIDA